MSGARHGVAFLVRVYGAKSFDDLAVEVAQAIGVPLLPGESIRVRDAFYADVFGLRVWLQLNEPDPERGRSISFMGAPEPPLEDVDDVEWVDLGPYFAKLLTERTSHQWATLDG